MKFAVKFFVGLLFWTALISAAYAQSVTDAWSRATHKGAKTGAIYFTLTNTSDHDLVLNGVTYNQAKRPEIHKIIHENGRMKMQHVSKIVIPAGNMISFKPGGYHIMLMGLNAELLSGQTYDFTLTFENHSDITAQFTVR